VPIVGPWCDAFGLRRERSRSTIELLSLLYGEAHAFYFGARGEGSAWLVARDGATIRRFGNLDEHDTFGDPLPVERSWMAAHGLRGRPESYGIGTRDCPEAMDDYPEANDIAATISVDVGWNRPVNPRTIGFPVLAGTPGTATIKLPPGLYDL
jgi:hypothetical protein